MFKKALAVLMALAVVVALILPALAEETVKGKVDALDRDANMITIDGTEYSLSDEAIQTDVAVGSEVQATVDSEDESDAEGGTVISLIKQ